MFRSKRLITKYDYDRIQDILNEADAAVHNRTIKKLKEKFKNAKLIDSAKMKSTVITMNTRFRLKNLGNGFKKECALVFPDDSDPRCNKYSVFDDLGSEFLAHEEGEVIHSTSGEDAYYLVENIIYQPESEGDYHL